MGFDPDKYGAVAFDPKSPAPPQNQALGNDATDSSTAPGFDASKYGAVPFDPNSPAAKGADGGLVQDFSNNVNTLMNDPSQAPGVKPFSDLLGAKGQDTIVPNINDTRSGGQQAVDTLLRIPFPQFQAENALRQTLGPDHPITTGVQQFNDSLGFGFGHDIEAGLDTLSDFLTGNVKHMPNNGMVDDLITQFQYNKDLRKEVLTRAAEKNPKSAAAGSITSMIPKMMLYFSGGGTGAYVGNAGISGIMSMLESYGISDKQLSDPNFYKDGVNAGLTGLLLGASQPAFRGLSKFLLPKTLDDAVGFSRIVNGGKIGGTPGVVLRSGEPVPRPIQGFAQAREAGFLGIQNNRVIQPEKFEIPSVSSILKNPKEAFTSEVLRQNWNSLKQVGGNWWRNPNAPIDYGKLQKQVSGSLDNLSDAKTVLINKTLKNQTYSLDEVFPQGAGKRTSTLIDNLDEIGRNHVDYNIPGSQNDVAYLNNLSRALRRGSVSGQELDEIQTNLGSLLKNYFGKNLPRGAISDSLDDWQGVKQFLKNKMNETSPGAGNHLEDINNKSSNFLAFQEHVNEGAKAGLSAHVTDPRYAQGGLSLLADKAGLKPGGSSSLLGFLGSSVKGTEKFLGLGANMLANGLQRPAFNSYLANNLFKSWNGDNKRIDDTGERALARHYIELNNGLSESDKLKAIHELNRDGKFSFDNVPKSVQDYARKKMQAEHMEQLQNGL